MISQHQIVRLIESREVAAATQLIERILANGRCRSALARRMLARPGAVEPAALGLAIQRICEMTYRPAPNSALLVSRLLELQSPNGTFGSASLGDNDAFLAASAVAIRALVAYRSQCAAFQTQSNARVNFAIAQGIDALAHHAADCLRDQIILAPVAWAIVLWQLGDVVEFRARVRTDAMLDLLDQTGAELIEDELARYAHAMAA